MITRIIRGMSMNRKIDKHLSAMFSMEFCVPKSLQRRLDLVYAAIRESTNSNDGIEKSKKEPQSK